MDYSCYFAITEQNFRNGNFVENAMNKNAALSEEIIHNRILHENPGKVLNALIHNDEDIKKFAICKAYIESDDVNDRLKASLKGDHFPYLHASISFVLWIEFPPKGK